MASPVVDEPSQYPDATALAALRRVGGVLSNECRLDAAWLARRRSARQGELAAIALLLLSIYGCSGDSGPFFSSNTDAPQPAASAIPASGSTEDSAGARAAVEGNAESAGGATASPANVAAPPSADVLGGAGGAGGAGDPTVSPASIPASACAGKLVDATSLIGDFEHGVTGWFGYVGQNNETVTSWPVLSTAPGAALSAHAATFRGGSASLSGMGHNLPCTDIWAFDGISFWAKSAASNNVRFLAVIPATDPTQGIGDCNPDFMTCSDHPGKLFTFSSDWRPYYAAWSELKQYGWGTKASWSNVINAVLWIDDGPVTDFDFSIDEVALYRGAPRLGP
jgi:hypothetical protein